MTIVSEENGVVEETAPFVHYRRAIQVSVQEQFRALKRSRSMGHKPHKGNTPHTKEAQHG